MIRHADECGCPKCETKRMRILAFGAIRRAVAEARAYDEQAEASTWIGPKAVWRYKSSAIAIRDAIRAAIGSDKT